ncbi:hypothetical protein RvY_15910 [Ramazzottius varieornatus]|uniref:Homeobox domain-containing protein n=1 Tax=Ramazzottius varieornatus TaxID=947166 RepID=A0A1D1W4E2_RAMVA|nr:hypothetical protein RvY_15910 [Ramazzottius varieornatus]
MDPQDTAGMDQIRGSPYSSSSHHTIALPDVPSYSSVSVGGQLPVVKVNDIAGTSVPLQTVLLGSSPALPVAQLAASPSGSNTSHSIEQSSLTQENLVGQVGNSSISKTKKSTSMHLHQTLPAHKSRNHPVDRKTKAKTSTVKAILEKPSRMRSELDRCAKKIRLLQTELLKERKYSAALKTLLENDSILLTEVPSLLKDLIKLHKCDKKCEKKFARRYTPAVLDFGCRVYSVSPAAFREVQKVLPMPRVTQVRELLRLDRLTAEQGGTLTYPGVAPRGKAVRFTPEQIDILKTYWAANKRPTTQQKDELARGFGVAPMKVRRWFDNENLKENKASRQQSGGSNHGDEEDEDEGDDEEEEEEDAD